MKKESLRWHTRAKQDELIVRWNETKDRHDISLEEYLQTTSTIFETYQKDNKGSVLTVNMIDMMMKGEDDIGINGAVPVADPPISPTTTAVVGQSSVSV